MKDLSTSLELFFSSKESLDGADLRGFWEKNLLNEAAIRVTDSIDWPGNSSIGTSSFVLALALILLSLGKNWPNTATNSAI